MKLFLSLALVVFSILGILDAGYITYEKFRGIIPPCGTGFSCGKVLESSWSSIGPIPLSLLGIFFYSTFLVLGILSVLEISTVKVGTFKVNIPFLARLLGVFGLGFSAWLVFLMGIVIQGWCLYCLLSAGNCFILFWLSQFHYFASRRQTQPEADPGDLTV